MRNIRRLLSLVLVFTLAFTNIMAYAESTSSLSTKEEEIIAIDVFESLDEEAQQIFINYILSDPELLDYHIKHVEKDFNVTAAKLSRVNTMSYSKSSMMMSRGSEPDYLELLKAELALLGLSSGLTYSLMAVGAGVVAAGADGPLLYGDIVGGLIAGIASAVILFHAKEYIQNKEGIKRAFSIVFSQIASDAVNALMKSFDDLSLKAQGLPDDSQFENFDQHHTKHAHEFADMPGGNGKKPDKKKYWQMAKEFLKKKGSNILTGKHARFSNRLVKFNTKTMEFLVYERGTNKIITYFLPRHWAHRNLNQWMLEAYKYYLNNIK